MDLRRVIKNTMIGSNPIQVFIRACESLIIYDAIFQGRLSLEPNPPVEQYGLIARCSDWVTALIVYSRRNEIERVLTQIRIPELKIVVRDRTYRTITTHQNSGNLMMQPNISIPTLSLDLQRSITERSQRHAQLLEAISLKSVAVTLHDCNESTGFMYLDLFAPIPARLNKQKEEVLGQPCRIVDNAISEPRTHAIKRTIKTGQSTRYQYTYEDKYRWLFDVTVAPLYGTEEVLTIVSDANSWQEGHWLNQLN